jgi:hypothetical protein
VSPELVGVAKGAVQILAERNVVHDTGACAVDKYKKEEAAKRKTALEAFNANQEIIYYTSNSGRFQL